MPTIYVQWLNTRSARQRAELAKRLTKDLADVAKVPLDMVNVIFQEVDPRMHSKGGVFYSDLLKKKAAPKRARRA